MHFRRDCAHTHRARGETGDDAGGRFDFLEWDSGPLPRLQSEKTTQGHQTLGLLVHALGVLAEHIKTLRPRGVLERKDRLRTEQVRGAFAAPLVLAAHGKYFVWVGSRSDRIRQAVTRLVFLRQHLETYTTDHRGGAGEVSINQVLAQPDSFECLRAGVGSNGGNAHLAHDLQHAFAERLDDVADSHLRLDPGDYAGAGQEFDGLHRQVRVDRRGSKTDEECNMVHFANVAGFHNKPDLHAFVPANEVVMHSREHQE